MYTKDLKKNVNLRLEKDLFDFVEKDAKDYGMSVSAYIRMLLRMSKNLVEKQEYEKARN